MHTLRQTTNRIEDDKPATFAQAIEVLHAYDEWLRRQLAELARDRSARYREQSAAFDDLLNFLNLPLTTTPKDAQVHVRALIKALKEAAIDDIVKRTQTGKLSLQTLKGHG